MTKQSHCSPPQNLIQNMSTEKNQCPPAARCWLHLPRPRPRPRPRPEPSAGGCPISPARASVCVCVMR
eukprot:1133621-Pelagomonas_calceolata.AAC.8